jgi:hypothetical protein
MIVDIYSNAKLFFVINVLNTIDLTWTLNVLTTPISDIT